ncbi:hypothetical protein B0H17DRAFT_1244460 [Mycena rosella]|uniref:DUF6534 domain-containing protein n=1 Tax=Mycena rosella TaxID=1033263 RepID=A0AAD7CZU5_MYCRO|nr:hypothetical protein B0H17DRAFT_1244460 [Mycena rosella]
MEANRPAPTPDEIASTAGPFVSGIIRGLVITISALETAQLILSTSEAWYYLIKTWGNFSGFFVVPREAALLVLLCGISSMIVQAFYVWRIWFLSYSYDIWLLRIVAVVAEGVHIPPQGFPFVQHPSQVSLMQGFSSIGGSVLVLANPTMTEVARCHGFFEAWLIGSFVTDTLISLCMLWILFKARHNTPRQSSKHMLNQLIINTVKTGCATTIVAAVTLALFSGLPHTTYNAATSNFLQKLYSISLLTNLNARQRINSGAEVSLELNLSDVIIQTFTDAASGTTTSYTEQPVTRVTPSRSLRAISVRFLIIFRMDENSRNPEELWIWHSEDFRIEFADRSTSLTMVLSVHGSMSNEFQTQPLQGSSESELYVRRSTDELSRAMGLNEGGEIL